MVLHHRPYGCVEVAGEAGRVDAHPEHQGDQRREHHPLPRAEVEDASQVGVDDAAEDDPAIQVQHVGRAQDHPHAAQQGEPEIHLQGTDDDQELADEAGGARQADGGHHEQHEHQGVGGHAVGEAAVTGDLAGVDAVVDDTNNQK